MDSTSYIVTVTDDGEWLHPAGSDFLFAYLSKDLPDDVKLALRSAFTDALQLPNKIKAEVKATSGQDVVNGLYLLNREAMTKAMNNVDGMGQTTDDTQTKKGRDVSVGINAEFFAAVLAGLAGDVSSMMKYLTDEMGDLQAQVRDSTVTESFGTVIGTISVEPMLGVPVTTFKYVFSDSKTSDWFVSVPCGTAEEHDYDYSFTVVDYVYEKPEKATA
jgi:hypothetical protein